MISIVVPCHNFNGKSFNYLKRLVSSIGIQTFEEYEIIISDQNNNEQIKNFSKGIKNAKYFKSPANNAPDNLNYAISKSNFEIIKPMFVDDYFNNVTALETINLIHQEGHKFVACATLHYDENDKIFKHTNIPFWQNKIIVGVNTIGCPSVISFNRSNKLAFDNNLKFLFDTEFYFQLIKLYNNVVCFSEPLVVTTINNGGAQNNFLNDKNYHLNLEREIEYCLLKHSQDGKNEN